MDKKQGFQDITTIVTIDYDLKKVKHAAVSNEEMDGFKNTMLLPAFEIQTPHPYSVFALCQFYEYSQRN
ncbi:MAG TPA: hypothetical protein VK808_04630 [Bacteroidia bacterium]|jgi:hypothetical protein|nr:hypothetical protein [Bacteroidia bacterium]